MHSASSATAQRLACLSPSEGDRVGIDAIGGRVGDVSVARIAREGARDGDLAGHCVARVDLALLASDLRGGLPRSVFLLDGGRVRRRALVVAAVVICRLRRFDRVILGYVAVVTVLVVWAFPHLDGRLCISCCALLSGALPCCCQAGRAFPAGFCGGSRPIGTPLQLCRFSSSSCILWFRRHGLRFWPTIALLSAGILVATVYLRYHYGVDAVARIAVVLLVVAVNSGWTPPQSEAASSAHSSSS